MNFKKELIQNKNQTSGPKIQMFKLESQLKSELQ